MTGPADAPPTPSNGREPSGDPIEGWPVDLRGVTETVVATLGPNGQWNQAALGVESDDATGDTAVARARTFGRTRTRRNFEERGEGYVQFTRDPVDFAVAALDVYETAEAILASTDAWVRVQVDPVDRRTEDETEVVTWQLSPVVAAVHDRVVPTTNRGRAAVVEATVAASRLDVDAYDEAELLDRLEWLGDVVDAAGDERDRAAFALIDDLTEWRSRLE